MEPRKHRDPNPIKEGLLERLDELLATRLTKPEPDAELEAAIRELAAEIDALS